jgi:hypothetical protein
MNGSRESWLVVKKRRGNGRKERKENSITLSEVVVILKRKFF